MVNSQTNTFQAILATDGEQSFVMFLYQQLDWPSHNTTSTNQVQVEREGGSWREGGREGRRRKGRREERRERGGREGGGKKEREREGGGKKGGGREGGREK